MPESRLTQFRNGPHTFDVIDSGPLDGTPVVLLHGFPQRASGGTPSRGTCTSRACVRMRQTNGATPPEPGRRHDSRTAWPLWCRTSWP